MCCGGKKVIRTALALAYSWLYNKSSGIVHPLTFHKYCLTVIIQAMRESNSHRNGFSTLCKALKKWEDTNVHKLHRRRNFRISPKKNRNQLLNFVTFSIKDRCGDSLLCQKDFGVNTNQASLREQSLVNRSHYPGMPQKLATLHISEITFAAAVFAESVRVRVAKMSRTEHFIVCCLLDQVQTSN